MSDRPKTFKGLPLSKVEGVTMPMQPCLLVRLADGELARQTLLDLQILDQNYSPLRIGDELALPISEDSDLNEMGMDYRLESVDVEHAPPPIDPHSRLNAVIASMVDSNEHLMQSVPKKWERLDDLILFPKDAFLGEEWASIIEQHTDFFERVADALNAKRIGRQQPIAADTVRSAQVELLHGTDGWVEVNDNGLVYGFDAINVMYSSGNVTERHRMAKMKAEGEIVIDAYAGIGYYTMQLLVHANVEHVHACEINPHSIKALEWAAEKNGVASKLSIHHQDNLITLRDLERTADRVLLGYLPSSEATWEGAIQALKPEGGTLHIHMNVEEERIDDWCKETLQQCLGYAKACGHDWDVNTFHLEKVKWYAPRIRHVVLDASFSSRSSAS